ncbi:protein-tyrosine phosphatase-like protein, partial [Epithele typhae]|uniref:protein-tyrosine phosphatase-like protein n=1 Tax=Epithele typhae TaxID=378194 RepID=UPI002008C927
SQILPRLYLSGYLAAINEQQLRDMRATHILSILELAPPFPPALVDDLHTMHVCLADDDDADILSHLGATTAFIASALQAENNVVLVHCAMGISRSPAVVCAYLIATEGMTPRDALDFCLSKRDIIDPNFGFRQQLEQF